MKKGTIIFFMILSVYFMPDCAYAQEQGVQQEQGTEKKVIEKQGTGTQDLLKKVQELEERVNTLTKQDQARKKLEITEKEVEKKEKDVLEAVGREYTMDTAGTLGIDYGLSYAYAPAETYTTQQELLRRADHTVQHLISLSYAILDNLSVGAGLPFVYRYNKLGTAEKKEQTDIGDISTSLSMQPFKTEKGQARTTFGLSAGLPTGRSPYEINPSTELSTGSGLYSMSASGNFSQEVDPVVVFGSISYSHSLPKKNINQTVSEGVFLDKVESGDTLGFGAGLAYAMSYKVSVNSSFSYSFQHGSTYTYKNTNNTSKKTKSGDSVGGTMSLGVGWRASEKILLSFGLGYSLTGPGFSLSFRAPFSFVL